MTERRYIIGPPGTGKTSTIARQVLLACERWGEDRVAICSLTKAAAQEAAGRVSLPEGRVGTLHSFAYHALGGNLEIAESHTKNWTEAYPHWPLEPVRVGVDEPLQERSGMALAGEELLAELNYLRARCEPITQARPLVREFAGKWQTWKREHQFIDFTDLLEQALHKTTVAPHNPAVLFVDEAQDLSALELALLEHWAVHLEFLVLVGDPYQNLYSWRGSDADVVFPHGANQSSWYVLSQSYRLPATVHTSAMRWLKRHGNFRDFAYAPRGEVGTVTATPDRLLQPDVWVEELEDLVQDYERIMIIAACGYLLKPLITALRARGLPFHNPWRKKQGAWNPLGGDRQGTSTVERILALHRREREGYWTPHDVRLWGTPLRASGVFVHGKKTELTLVAEDMPVGAVPDLLREVFLPETCRLLETLDGPELLDWWQSHLLAASKDSAAYPVCVVQKRGIDALLETPRIIPGTIHSLKGSEADMVFLAPDLSHAGHQELLGGGEGRDAIIRQFYVGMTRAKEHLRLLAPSTKLRVELF